MTYQDICKGLKKEAGMRKKALTPKGKLLEGLQNLLKLTVNPIGKQALRAGLRGERGANPIQRLGHKLYLRNVRPWGQRPIGNGIKDLVATAKSADQWAPRHLVRDGRYDWESLLRGRGFNNEFLRPLRHTQFKDKLSRSLARLKRRVNIPSRSEMTDIINSLKDHLKQNGEIQRLTADLRSGIEDVGGTSGLYSQLESLLSKI